MKSIDEAEAQTRLDEILGEAQQYPIVIQRRGQDVAVILSMAMASIPVIKHKATEL